MKKLTLAERIGAGLELGLSTREIARIFGCGVEYVRAVKQRIAGGGKSKGDRSYAPKARARRRERYHADPEYRARRLAISQRWAEQNREARAQRRRARYHSDAEFRERELAARRACRARQRNARLEARNREAGV